jgi:hypothetical protein
MSVNSKELLSAAIRAKWESGHFGVQRAAELLAERVPGFTAEQYAEASQLAAALDKAAYDLVAAWLATGEKRYDPMEEKLKTRCPEFSDSDYSAVIRYNSNLPKQRRSGPIHERVAEAIAPTDRIMVYLLDPVKDVGRLGTFPLYPYGPQAGTGIHEAKALEGESAIQLLRLWSDTLRDDEGRQAMCHYPIHGLRFFCGESMLYETSLCWVCNNYYAATEQGYLWLGLPGGCPDGPPTLSCAALRQLLEFLLPIPESLARKVEDGGTTPGQARGGYGGKRVGRTRR